MVTDDAEGRDFPIPLQLRRLWKLYKQVHETR